MADAPPANAKNATRAPIEQTRKNVFLHVTWFRFDATVAPFSAPVSVSCCRMNLTPL
jgi:hypothetical protein